MADTVLIYTQGHPRGFKISSSLGDPTVRELLKQIQMLIPDNLASALVAYKESRCPTQEKKLPRVTTYDLPLLCPLGQLNQYVLPIEEADMVLPATKRKPLAPPPMGALQEVGPHRALRADDGMSLGTVHRPGVRGSTVALNLEAECLRAVGNE